MSGYARFHILARTCVASIRIDAFLSFARSEREERICLLIRERRRVYDNVPNTLTAASRTLSSIASNSSLNFARRTLIHQVMRYQQDH